MANNLSPYRIDEMINRFTSVSCCTNSNTYIGFGIEDDSVLVSATCGGVCVRMECIGEETLFGRDCY